MPINKFNKETTETIIASVRRGNYLKTAAASAGVSYRSIATWMAEGKEESSVYHEFFLAVTKAKADFEKEALSVIVESNQPKYLLEVLARQNPTTWSTASRVNVEIRDQICAFMDFLCDSLANDPDTLEKVLKIATNYENNQDDN